MTYEKAVAYIEELPKFTKKHPLEHTKDFLKRLGNPAFGRKIIHVAGTNGKGSVCAYLETFLTVSGKKTGFFTSPHLVFMNERIRIEKHPISDEMFLGVFRQVYEAAVQMQEEGAGHPTYFEFLFAMGMKAFEESDLEYVILETGLGGRLDATNAITHPMLTVITSISLDHTDILGETIEKIAWEKAGIVKEEVPVIFENSNDTVCDVIKGVAAQRKSPCREISKNAYEIKEVTRKSIAFSRTNAYDRDVTWTIPICGVYQVMNACLAMEAAESLLLEKEISTNLWKEALSSMKWEGRMEEVVPHVILDGAHNQGAVEAFADTLETLYQGKKNLPVIIFSAVLEKNYEKMVECVCQRISARCYIVTEVEDKRRVPAVELKEIFRKYTDTEVICEREIEAALTQAQDRRGGADIYCIGSLYLVGMVKKLLAGGGKDA